MFGSSGVFWFQLYKRTHKSTNMNACKYIFCFEGLHNSYFLSFTDDDIFITVVTMNMCCVNTSGQRRFLVYTRNLLFKNRRSAALHKHFELFLCKTTMLLLM